LTERIQAADGSLISSIQSGSIDLEKWAAAARPNQAEASRLGAIYNEGGWEFLDEDGNTHVGYTLTREDYHHSQNPVFEEKRFPSNILLWIEQGETSDVKPLIVRLKGFAEWDIPLMPPVDLLTQEEVNLGVQLRRDAIQERKGLLASKARQVANTVGIEDYIELWVTGEIFFFGNPGVAAALQKLPEVVRIAEDEPVTSNACSTSTACSGANAFSPLTQWRLGQGRRINRTNVDSYLGQGWTGERANPSRHAFGDIIISVLETQTFEDEYLGFNDSSIFNPMSRIRSRYTCAAGSCDTRVNFPDVGSEGNHGTLVASAAAANFQANQAYNVEYNDVCYTGRWSHCALWDEAASGYAPHSSLQLIADSHSVARRANGFARMIETQIDIANLSTSNKEICPRCRVEAQNSDEVAAENAFDDGIFIVNAPENLIPEPYGCDPVNPAPNCCNDPGQIAMEPFQPGDCTLDSPGVLPKVFTVNALNVAGLFDYQNSGFHSGSWGGMDANLPGGTQVRAISGIDMIAPGLKTFLGTTTDCPPEEDRGCVEYLYTGGTSIAAPTVSGAAAILKDGMLGGGHHFINSPGRLHTIMLAMADRTDGSGTHKAAGSHALWGMGKLKMRRTSEIAGGWGMWTKTFTSSSGNYIQRAFGTPPLPASANFLKCVMFEAEDVSHKTTVGDLFLSISLGDPVGGSCPTTPSGESYGGIDASYDLKHMIAYSGTLQNKCPYFTIHKGVVAGSTITAHTYCYYGNQNDSWPN
jgi:hypothetical protein